MTIAELSFSDFDIFHLGISGGKDSTATLLKMIKESDLPRDRLRVTSCDTGNEDALTYAYLAMLAERICPIETIFPERDFWELAQWKGRFPSKMAQFCTQWLKIIPSRDYVLELQRQGAKVLLLNGVRSAEAHNSNDRGEVPKFGWDESFACDIYRPILDWSLDDVWGIHKRHLDIEYVLKLIAADPELNEENKACLNRKMAAHGVPRNPLYDMGASRVGCFP